MAAPKSSRLEVFYCTEEYLVPINVSKSSVLFAVAKALIPIESCMAVLIVLVNTTVTLTILLTKSLRSKTYYKGIACMNILDFLIGAVTIPLTRLLLKNIIDNSSPMTLCTAAWSSLVCGCTLSSLTLSGMAFLSIDRYFSICHAHRYHDIFRKGRVASVVVVLVSYSVVSTLLVALEEVQVFAYVNSVEVFLLITLFSVIYYKIFKTVAQSSTQSHRGSSHNRQHRDMSRKLLFIVVVIFICYAPMTSLSFIMQMYSKEVFFSAHYISYALVLANSLLNPLLFLWQDSVLRKATIAFATLIFSKIKCTKPDDLSTNRVAAIHLQPIGATIRH